MIVLLKKKPGKDELTNLVEWLCSMGLDVHVSEGKERMLLGLIGDTSCVDIDLIRGARHRGRRQAHSGTVQKRKP